MCKDLEVSCKKSAEGTRAIHPPPEGGGISHKSDKKPRDRTRTNPSSIENAPNRKLERLPAGWRHRENFISTTRH